MTTGWWMYHGDAAHTGNVAGSGIDAANVANLTILHTLQLGGPIMSVPAVSGGYVYVGTANAVQQADGSPVDNGGFFHKIELATGTITNTFTLQTDSDEGETHLFCFMGCTPAVVNGKDA